MFQKNERRADDKKPVVSRTVVRTAHDPPITEVKRLQQ